MPQSVVVADDQPSIRSLLVRVIHRVCPQAHIVDVGNGRGVFDAWQQSRPGLVLLDHGLPDMSGFHVLSYLKAQPDAPYVVVITGDSFLEEEALRRGADEVWLKPMDFGALIPHLSTLLRLR